MGRRRRDQCCNLGRNFKSKCFNIFLSLKIFIWLCIWGYLLKYYILHNTVQWHKNQMDYDQIGKTEYIDIMINIVNIIICFVIFVTILLWDH